MKILPINSTDTRKPVFKSCTRAYNPIILKSADCFEKDIVRTSTNILREDLEWNVLMKFIKQHFANKEKVNVYSLAASDGSEAYSFVVSVLDWLPQELHNKFLPVFASDIDKEVINSAKSGRINLYSAEIYRAERYYGINTNKYFTEPKASVFLNGDYISESEYVSSYKVADIVRNSVKFKQSDILTELNNIKDDGNSIVMCRNVFPYLNKEYTEKIINTAKHNLKEGSLFIIGDFDLTVGTDGKLAKNGFFQPLFNGSFISSDIIFERGSSKDITDKLIRYI